MHRFVFITSFSSLLLLSLCKQSISEHSLDNHNANNENVNTRNDLSRSDDGNNDDASKTTSTTEFPLLHRTVRNTGNETKNGTGSAFDYLYDYLLESDNKKMCSLMRESDVEPKLKEIGEFTIFVPSDEAMSLIPGSLSDELSNDPQKRNDFILSHVVPGNILLRPLRPYQEISTSSAQGSPIKISAYIDGFVVNGANIFDGDKRLGNGNCTVQFVDKVLYPPPSDNLIEHIDKNYKQMSRLLKQSGLENKLQKNMITCFVPTDDAFRAVPWSITQQLLTNRTLLKSVIESHVIPGNFYSLGLPGNQVNSINGEVLTFDKKKIQSREMVLINSVPIVNPDQVVTNGVIHGISRVLLPKSLLEDCKCDKTTTNANTDTTTTLSPVYIPTRSSTQTPLRDETAPNSFPSTPNTERPSTTDVFFRREPSLGNDDRNRNPKSLGNNNSDAPYVVNFTPTTPQTVADISSTYATTTPTPIFFRATRKRVPPRNPITRQYDPRRTAANRNTDSLFTELYPYSPVTDFYSTPTTVYYPYNPYTTFTTGGRNATDTQATSYDPTRRTPNTGFFTNEDTPSVSYPTYRQQFDRTGRPTSNFNNFNTFDTSTPTSTNAASTTLSPFFRRTNTDTSSTKTTSTYEMPLQPYTNNRRKPIFESRTTTELPFWATLTSKPVNTNTVTSTRRIINDKTEPSTVFFDSTRRPTFATTFDNRRGLTRPSTIKAQNTREEDEIPTNEYITTKSPLNRSPVRNVSRTPVNDDEILKSDPQTIDEIMDEPGLVLNGKPVSFNSFKDDLRRSGLTNLLSSEGPFTVFMPTDDAYKLFSPSTYNNLKKNPTKLRNMLLRHVTNVQIPPSALQNNFVVQTFSGDSLQITVESVGKRVLVMGVPIMAATSARNGIIYVIGNILQPTLEEDETENLVGELQKRPELTRFTKFLEKTSFNKILKGNKEFTLLAPDNSAFEELSPNIKQMIESDPKVLEKMIGNHVIEGKYSSNQLMRIRFLPASGGTGIPLQFSALPGSIIVNNLATFIQFDIPAGNGVIHITNRILVPDDIVVKATTKQPSFTEYEVNESREPIISNESDGSEMRDAEKNSKFMKALRRTALLDKLVESRREYTLIIPSDKAIDKLPEKLKTAMELSPHRLKALFNYHIIPEYIDFGNLKNDEMLPSISGKPIRFNKYNNGSELALSGAMIDKVSSEGNVLMIFVDRVLYPPQGNIYEIVKRSPILKMLTKLVETAKLDRELSQSGPFTLFAPNDEAFNKLPANTLQPLFRSSVKSREFLLRHVVQPLIFTSAIPVGKNNTTDVTNAAGERLKLQRLPDCVSVDGVTLSFADVTATNGVVHVIDHVL